MKQFMPALKLCFISLVLFAPLTMGHPAAQVKKGTSSVVLAGLQMNVTHVIT
jgi:hypothetical protein